MRFLLIVAILASVVYLVAADCEHEGKMYAEKCAICNYGEFLKT